MGIIRCGPHASATISSYAFSGPSAVELGGGFSGAADELSVWSDAMTNRSWATMMWHRADYPAPGVDADLVGRCKLDPSLKAICFQPLNLRFHTVLST